jgi:uroporphyrinogen-III decarboxylase
MKKDEFEYLYRKRLIKVEIETDDVFRHKKVDFPPFIINSAFYHLFGLEPEIIPNDYCTNPMVMTKFQEEANYEQIKAVDDYFVPYLLPWMGTAVLSSALGSKVVYPEKADPSFDPREFPVETANDIKKLEIADPDKDGLMPKVLDCIRYMKNNSFLPVGITDCQGPLATAYQLMGYDKFIFMMYENPNAAHELMDKITESLIIWIKRQKAEIGESSSECFGDQQIYIGKNAGVWLADDDAVLINSELYKEFVVPYNSRIFQEFNNGILHYCGTANHQIENFLNTKGLIGINNYCLHDIKGVVELKKQIENKLVLILCDFTPLDYKSYYSSLLESISPTGLIIDSQFSSILALSGDGKYNSVFRDKYTGRKDIFDYIKSLR